MCEVSKVNQPEDTVVNVLFVHSYLLIYLQDIDAHPTHSSSEIHIFRTLKLWREKSENMKWLAGAQIPEYDC